ncbi:MAG TPA: DUF2784 domain-containing protein [Casimicrobiaceae bacterium]|nr:DUF2784 domain-containing protein [Casimicrobiaceae bacterium]
MLTRSAVDAALLLHFAFIAFVMLGALLAIRWQWIIVAHVPAVAWGAFIEATGGICPLTPIENRLRTETGLPSYGGGFIEHYLMRIIYPDGLTRATQYVLAGVVIVVNGAIYGWLLYRRRRVIADNPAA